MRKIIQTSEVLRRRTSRKASLDVRITSPASISQCLSMNSSLEGSIKYEMSGRLHFLLWARECCCVAISPLIATCLYSTSIHPLAYLSRGAARADDLVSELVTRSFSQALHFELYGFGSSTNRHSSPVPHCNRGGAAGLASGDDPPRFHCAVMKR